MSALWPPVCRPLPPPPQPNKPGCAQSSYTEALPTSDSLADLSFSSATANDYLVAALGKRYPIGKAIVEGAERAQA